MPRDLEYLATDPPMTETVPSRFQLPSRLALRRASTLKLNSIKKISYWGSPLG